MNTGCDGKREPTWKKSMKIMCAIELYYKIIKAYPEGFECSVWLDLSMYFAC